VFTLPVLFCLYHCLFQLSGHPRSLHSFPTRRSSDLTRMPSASYLKNGAWRLCSRRVNRPASARSSRCTLRFCCSPEWPWRTTERSEEHTSELQSRGHPVCRLLLEKKKHIHTSTVRRP